MQYFLVTSLQVGSESVSVVIILFLFVGDYWIRVNMQHQEVNTIPNCWSTSMETCWRTKPILFY